MLYWDSFLLGYSSYIYADSPTNFTTNDQQINGDFSNQRWSANGPVNIQFGNTMLGSKLSSLVMNGRGGTFKANNGGTITELEINDAADVELGVNSPTQLILTSRARSSA